MSWLVKNLIKNRLQIHEQSELDSDNYNDLLVVEKKIEELYNNNILSKRDIEILSFISEGNIVSNKINKFNVERHLLSKEFSSICDRIAFYLGGYFTDDGYMNYMKNKYKLSELSVERMKDYMKSNFRKDKLRKSTNESN